MKLTVLFSLMFLTSLSFGTIKFDMSKIYELSAPPGPGDTHTHRPPYYVHFKHGDKEIFYLSSKHSMSLKSKTHKGINHILNQQNITGSVVELQTFDKDNIEDGTRVCKEQAKCFEGIHLYMKSRA